MKDRVILQEQFPWESIPRHLIPGIFIVSITQMVLCMQWVSLKWSVMQLALMLAKALYGETDFMLTIIPAQYGVSLTSREELMPAIRKPSTVTEMPNASCNKANSSGKRQPQQVWDSSSWPVLGSPLVFFCFFFFFIADSCVLLESVLFSPSGAFPVWLWLFRDVPCWGFFSSSFPMPMNFRFSRACVCVRALMGVGAFLPPKASLCAG